MGPPLESVKKAFQDSAYYHIEIFISLPGRQEELFKEREMEIARRAGFADADAIGPYLRTFIDMHRDTMGVAIK
jgi:hypothetical protein